MRKIMYSYSFYAPMLLFFDFFSVCLFSVCPPTKITYEKNCPEVGPRAGRRFKITTHFILNRGNCRCDTRVVRVLIPCSKLFS